jgi:Txe/YoeB family toxin of Txe-Axe toxin-antitoxin module
MSTSKQAPSELPHRKRNKNVRSRQPGEEDVPELTLSEQWKHLAQRYSARYQQIGNTGANDWNEENEEYKKQITAEFLRSLQSLFIEMEENEESLKEEFPGIYQRWVDAQDRFLLLSMYDPRHPGFHAE